jgi:regulator of replication initiation timing
VRVQLEALVAEKSALAQENARLHRENTNLQELLSYTMQRRHTGVGHSIQDPA